MARNITSLALCATPKYTLDNSRSLMLGRLEYEACLPVWIFLPDRFTWPSYRIVRVTRQRLTQKPAFGCLSSYLFSVLTHSGPQHW
jgi:hypothetical protein